MITLLFYLITIIVTSFIVVRYLMETWILRVYRLTRDIPGPPHRPIFGTVIDLWDDIDKVFLKAHKGYAKEYPDIYRMSCLNSISVNILDPKDAEIILTHNSSQSKGHIYKFIHKWLRFGLLTSEGKKWHKRRKILTPSFHFNILKQFAITLSEQSAAIVNTLDKDKDEQTLNVNPFLTDFTLHSLCETTMGLKIDPQSASIRQYKKALLEYGNILQYRIFRPWIFSDFIFYNFTRLGWRASKLENILHKFTSDIIDERLSNWDESILKTVESSFGKKRLAMLDFLISQLKQGDIDYEGVKEEVDTFMFEGHDTTTSGLTFSLLVLANYQSIQNKVYEELQDIFGDSERLPTYEDLQNMSYLERCIKEVLRLYPPVHFISRMVDDDIKLTKYTVPKDSSAFVHIYDIHRNPKYWTNPEEFDPDRFLPDNLVNKHPYAYIPFSGGPRNCIGQRFALLEEKALISTILRKYKLDPVDTIESVVLFPDFVLRPKHDIKIILRRRTM